MNASMITTNRRPLSIRALLGACATAVGVAAFTPGAAVAGEGKAETNRTTTTSSTSGSSDVHQQSTYRDGGTEIKITRDNADVKASVNGQPVQVGGTWKSGDTEVKIVRESGEIVAMLNARPVLTVSLEDNTITSGHTERDSVRRARDMSRELRRQAEAMRQAEIDRRQAGTPGASSGPMGLLPPGAQPKVMIGVTMDTPDEDADLPKGYDRKGVTVITSVVEGLAAEKAGLEDGDIVVAVNGKAPATPGAIREALQGKDPGDELRLKVIRDAVEHEITIKLTAFEPGKLGRGFPGATGFGPAWGLFGEKSGRLDELRNQMAAISEEMHKMGAELAHAKSETAKEITQKMAELGAVMGKLGGEMARLSAENIPAIPPDVIAKLRNLHGPRIYIQRGGDHAGTIVPIEPPEPPEPPEAGDGLGATAPHAYLKRMDQVDERLDRLEKLLERIAEQQLKDSGAKSKNR